MEKFRSCYISMLFRDRVVNIKILIIRGKRDCFCGRRNWELRRGKKVGDWVFFN